MRLYVSVRSAVWFAVRGPICFGVDSASNRSRKSPDRCVVGGPPRSSSDAAHCIGCT